MRNVENVDTLLLTKALVVLVAVTVALGQTIGRSLRSKALKSGLAIGITPAGNQDQFVDNVVCAAYAEAASGVTLASAVEVSITAPVGHQFAVGDRVLTTGFVGTVELNDNEYTVSDVTGQEVSLEGTDGDDFTAYTSGGVITCVDGNSDVTVTLAAAATADNEFNVGVYRPKESFIDNVA